MSRVAWLDASGQSQDEDEGGDEEEDAGEGGDEDEDRRKLQAVAGYSVTLTVTDEAGDEGEDADEDRRLQAGGDLRRTPDKGKKHDARTVAALSRC